MLDEAARVESLGVLSGFRADFYECLTARADGLFELAEAVLCAEGPVRSLVGLALAPEHRRGHGALYDALNCGRADVGRLRRSLAGFAVAEGGGWADRAGRGCVAVAAPGRRHEPGPAVLPRPRAGAQ